MKIISLANQKGGVAKTTSTYNLAALKALSHNSNSDHNQNNRDQNNNRVLMIDLDPQASLTISCGFTPGTLDFSTCHLFDGKTDPIDEDILAEIVAGTFKGIYPCDYFNFTNVAYTYQNASNVDTTDSYTGIMRIMHLDYPQYCGISIFPHCILVVPDVPLFDAKMNSDGTFEGGYGESEMRRVALRRAQAIFEACFGADHLITRSEYLVNKVDLTTTIPTGVGLYETTIELMDERMIWGDYKLDCGVHNKNIEPEASIFPYKQLAAFRHNHNLVKAGKSYWSRNVSSGGIFVSVRASGYAINYSAAGAYGVRPFALIGLKSVI